MCGAAALDDLFSVLCPLSSDALAFGERVTAYLLYNGSAS